MVTSAVDYLERDATLPDMGASGLGPRAMTASDVDVIMVCKNLPALAQMSAYAQSYFATAGGIVLGSVGAVGAAALRRPGVAVASAVVAGAATLVTVEARRRARQWDAVIQARIAALAHSPG